MNNYGQIVSDVGSSQFEKISGKNMGLNNSGAYVFKIDSWSRLNRFLIIGVQDGTYYQSKKDLVEENYTCLLECLNEDFKKTIDIIINISKEGRSPKNDHAIFALSVACVNSFGNSIELVKSNKNYAYSVLHKVCRIGTHLFQFLVYYKSLSGKKNMSMSSGLQKAIRNYYKNKGLNSASYDCFKYKNREGITHKDVFKQLRWKDDTFEPLIDYVLKGEASFNEIPPIISADILLRETMDVDTIVAIIEEYNVPWEMVPTEFLNEKKILGALIPKIGINALIRNLSRLTKTGTITNSPECKNLDKVFRILSNEEYITKSKVHPLFIANATIAYSKGKSRRDEWTPIPLVIKALDDAFIYSFKNANSMNIPIDVAIDVSASMNNKNGELLTAREVSAVMSSYFLHKENFVNVYAFSSGYTKLDLPYNYRQIINQIDNMSFDYTDCSLPIKMALLEKRKVDLFIVITDNETNSRHSGHASEYLKRYKQIINPKAKMVVLGVTATDCSIADPNMPDSMLDIAGFDSSISTIIEEFVKGF